MSRVYIALTKSVVINKSPRNFIFDRPYLLILKEKNAQYPYLLMWDDNEEILQRDASK